MTCVYVNPGTDQFWLIDYRLYDPGGDGKSKLDHVHDVLNNPLENEQLHRESKQVTGLERCQCRKARIRRNHIGCALLVWVRPKHYLAGQAHRTIY